MASTVLVRGGTTSPADAAAAVAADKAKAWLDLSPAWDRDRHEALQTALHAVGATLQHEPLVEAVLHADHFDRLAEALDAVLLTRDGRLAAAAGRSARVELV